VNADERDVLIARTGICPACGDAACAVCERCAVCQGHHDGCARAPFYRPPTKVKP
jgi:hypothetical protein